MHSIYEYYIRNWANIVFTTDQVLLQTCWLGMSTHTDTYRNLDRYPHRRIENMLIMLVYRARPSRRRWSSTTQSHQYWDLEWPSHQNPTRWNFGSCSTKLPHIYWVYTMPSRHHCVFTSQYLHCIQIFTYLQNSHFINDFLSLIKCCSIFHMIILFFRRAVIWCIHVVYT